MKRYNIEVEKKRLQDEEYYLPYHWLFKKGARQVQLEKIGLVADLLLSYGPDKGMVLDLGCGDGKNTWELQQIFDGKYQLAGVDFSERAITYARMLAPGIHFEVQDARLEGFLPSSIDAVVSIEVIEHVPVNDVPVFLKQIFTMLKPNALLILTTPTTNRPVDEKHFQHFDEGMLRKYLNDAGFELKTVSGFGVTLPVWLDKLYRYIIELPGMWRLQKHVQGAILPARNANNIVVAAIKTQK